MAKAYVTQYFDSNGRRRLSHIWAKNEEHARELASARGICETLHMRAPDAEVSTTEHPEPAASSLLNDALRFRGRMDASNVQNTVHALTWLLFLYHKHSSDAAHALSDTGWFHESVHALDGDLTHTKIRQTVASVEEAERKIPGYLQTPNQSGGGG